MKELLLVPRRLLLILVGFLARIREFVVDLYRRIPGNRGLDRIADLLTRPIRGLAAWTLRTFPRVKRWEWLLETERIRGMHPTLLFVLLAFVFYRGLRTTYLGHIATDYLIYPYLGALSYFNPFLGILSAISFGLGDILQKIVFNDIFGSAGVREMAFRTAYHDGNYWGGIVGYCLAYSSPALAGILPGVLARVFRLAARRTMAFFFFGKTAAAADGAQARREPAASGAQGVPGAQLGALYPGGGEPAYPLAELAASMLGAGVGGAFVMYTTAPVLEAPAFLLRPFPDTSCHDMEVSRFLRQPAFRQGLRGPAGGGPLINGLIPPGMVSGGPAGPGRDGGPEGGGGGPGEDGSPDPHGDTGSSNGEKPAASTDPEGGPATATGSPPELGPLVDPRTGEPLIVHDGGYEGGRPGQVWLDGQWQDPAAAAAFFRQWEQDYERDRQQWFDDRTRDWEEDLARKRAEEGLDYDPYQDAWRKPPPAIDWQDVPPEDPDIFQLQKRPGDPGRLYRWLIGPSDMGFEKFNQHLNELDTRHDRALEQYKDMTAKHRAAQSSGDQWLEDHYRQRRAEAAANLSRLRGARLDLNNRYNSRLKGGAAYNKYVRDYQKMSLGKAGQAGKELLWDPVSHIVKPDLGGDDGPLARSFKKLKESSDWMRLRAQQQPDLDAQFQNSMDEVKVLTDQLRDAESRGDDIATRAIKDQLKAARDRALEANHRRGDLANRTRDWEKAAAKVTTEYYKTQLDRAGAGQAQYQALRSGSRIASRLSDGAFSADAPAIRDRGAPKGEWEEWKKLREDNPEAFKKIRQEMGGEGGSTRPPPDLTPDELEMNRQFQQKQWVADRKIERYEQNRGQYEEATARLQEARRSGNAQEMQDALKAHQDAERRLSRSVKRNLADPHVKAKLKRAPSDVQNNWATDAEQFRTNPLRKNAADVMNRERNWVVEESPGTYRRVRMDDLEPVSGSRGPGQDLDLAPNKRIIDPSTGKRVPDAELQGAVNQAAKRMRMDPGRQDIHVVSDRHPAAYRVRPGETPQDALSPGRVRDASAMDGEHYHQVSEYKRTVEAGGDLAEKARGAVKDYKRFTEPMLERHPGARRPRVFNDKAMEVMEEVGNRTKAPGTGNAEFRQLTGMDLDEGAGKLNSMQESVPKLDTPSRRIEIARSRTGGSVGGSGSGSGSGSGVAAPAGLPDGSPGAGTSNLKSLVGETGPAVKTPKGQKLHDYLEKRDVRSFMDHDGNPRGFGRKPEPEVTNTGDAVRARAQSKGILDPGQESARQFHDRLQKVLDQDPAFKQLHDKVDGAIRDGFSKRIDQVRDIHHNAMVDEGGWGDPGSPTFNAELDRRLTLTPLDDPKTVQLQQRSLFEHGVTEQEFDLFMDVRQKLFRGQPVGPMEPPPPPTGTTPHYLDVSQRLGSAAPSGPTLMGQRFTDRYSDFTKTTPGGPG